MENINHEIVFSQDEIQNKIKEIATHLNNYYKNNNKNIFFIPILEGVLPFFGQLILYLDFHTPYESIIFNSYKGNIQKEEQFLKNIGSDLEGKDVVLVDTIADGGKTLSIISQYILKNKSIQSLKSVVLVDRPNNRKTSFKVDFVGFEYLNPNFLIGFGLDYNGLYRNLPYLASI